MSPKLLGPLTGVGVSVICSGLGVVVASTLGANIPTSVTLVHVAAAVVLLVTILSRIENQQSS